MEHYDALAYKVERLPDQLASTLTSQPFDDGIEFALTCQRCQGHFSRIDYPEAIRGATASASTPVPVVCDCGGSHPGAPDGEWGCGACWDILP